MLRPNCEGQGIRLLRQHMTTNKALIHLAVLTKTMANALPLQCFQDELMG